MRHWCVTGVACLVSWPSESEAHIVFPYLAVVATLIYNNNTHICRPYQYLIPLFPMSHILPPLSFAILKICYEFDLRFDELASLMVTEVRNRYGEVEYLIRGKSAVVKA